MNVVLLGIQGAGKGSVLMGLESYLDFTLISVGQILRDEVKTGSALGKHIDKLQTEGKLVETEIVVEVLKERLKHKQKLTIFDGFPRNAEQAELLDKILKVDLVIYLKLTRSVAIKRLLNRLTCSKCGYVTQSIKGMSNACPKCMGELTQRKDDTEQAILKRFETFEKDTLPLVERYSKQTKVATIDASRDLSSVVEEVLKVINECDN